MSEFEQTAWERCIKWRAAMALPLIVAPMTGVSNVELAAASCAAGVIGSFPTHNAPTADELDAWMCTVASRTTELVAAGNHAAPLAVNLMLRRPAERVAADLECIQRHATPIVIASVGSPKPIVAPLHEAGTMVLADVATMRHVRSALAAGVDGLVLLTAGAGGQTGWMNGMSFVRAVRRMYEGPIVIAGGIYDGTALWAAEILGCDMGYMGTPFIATHESAAEPMYRSALVESSMDDVELTVQESGIAANLLTPSADRAPTIHGYSAGHTVSAVRGVVSVAELVDQTRQEYNAARAQTAAMLTPSGVKLRSLA